MCDANLSIISKALLNGLWRAYPAVDNMNKEKKELVPSLRRIGDDPLPDDYLLTVSTKLSAKPDEISKSPKGKKVLTKDARHKKQIHQRTKPWPANIPRPEARNKLYDPDYHPAALVAWVEKEGFMLIAVQQMGIAMTTHANWIKTYPEYAEAAKVAHLVAEQWLSKRAKDKCIGKNPNGDSGMIKFLLERRHGYLMQSQVDINAKVEAKVAVIEYGTDQEIRADEDQTHG